MACRTILFGAAIMPALTAAAIAQPKYDAKLEQAAMQVIAGKIGDIRPGFRYDQNPAFVVSQEPSAPNVQDRTASWQIVPSDHRAQTGSTGSIQMFSDDSVPKAEEREEMSRAVSRVIKF
ncbi:hypothetical protein [Mesorhizobium sp. IMUNJ 23232]|uniref:hypothetical protein n=1 Tax=Mesorhizobium sp. IMUNJ 23232 TaxID=3376064 RepID=UPI003792DA60